MDFKRSGVKLGLVLASLLILLLLSTVSAAAADSDLLQKAARINEGCLRCHAAQGLNTIFDGKPQSLTVDTVKYKASMHGTMACTYCHTNIVDYPHTQAPKGKALKAQVNGECRRCHKDITTLYSQSVHGQLNKQGRQNAYCSDCHGIHNINKKQVPEASIAHNKVPYTCAQCHTEIMKKYQLDFHAKSVLLGGQEAASCVSCHGSHNILGPAAKASTVSKENTPKTCGKCHLFALDNFANGKTHYELKPTGDGSVAFWTLEFFTWLTILTVTFLLLIILMELRRKWFDAGRPDNH